MSGDRPPTETTYPEVNPAFVPVVHDENTVEFRTGLWNGPTFTLSDSDEEGVLGELVSLFDGSTHVREIVSTFEPRIREEVVGVIRALESENILFDATDADARERSGQRCLRAHIDEQSATGVADADVLVVNVGEMGPPLAADLARFGVGTVRLFEDGAATDRTGADDLPAAVDEYAADFSDLEGRAADVDVLAYVTDRPTPDYLEAVNEITAETGTPWISGQVCGVDAVVGPTVVPGRSSCYRCFELRARLCAPDEVGFSEYKARADRRVPRMAGLASIVRGFLYIDLVNYLTGSVAYTIGHVLTVNAHDFELSSNEVLRLPDCPVCGTDRSIERPEFHTLADVVEDMDVLGSSGGR